MFYFPSLHRVVDNIKKLSPNDKSYRTQYTEVLHTVSVTRFNNQRSISSPIADCGRVLAFGLWTAGGPAVGERPSGG